MPMLDALVNILAATRSSFLVCSSNGDNLLTPVDYVKPSRATVAFASVSSDSTLRTIAFDSSARHGTETICSDGPALTKIDRV